MDDAKTVWCGNLSDKVTEELLYELFLQAAPLERVKIPTDREGRRSNFAFITFKHEISVEYAIQLLNGIKLFERNITVKPRQANNQRNNAQHQQQENHGNVQVYSQVTVPQQFYEDLINMGQNINANNNYGSNQNRWRQNYRDREHRGRRQEEYRGSPNNRRPDRRYDRNRQNRHY